jgi:CDP-diacylglycerol--serine O-phosphatidyltransferase
MKLSPKVPKMNREVDKPAAVETFGRAVRLVGWRHALRRRRPHRPRRRVPPVTVLPTLCTLGNLVAGFAAIFYAARPESYIGPWNWSPLTMAGAMVFLGMFLDAIDGSIARLMRSNSELGSQLDSFADAVTFGVAPAFMTLMLVARYLSDDTTIVIIGPEADNVVGRIIWGMAAVYVCCAALRLARFNIEVGRDESNDHRMFRGLPSPGAAGAVASLVILHQHLLLRFPDDIPRSFARAAALGIPVVMLLCALAMVSSIPYVHFTNRYLHGPRSFHYIVRLALAVVFLAWWFQETIAAIFVIYVLSGPVRLLTHWRRARGGEAMPAPKAQPPLATARAGQLDG